MKLPAFDTEGLWLLALGLWCNMVARCVYRLPDFAYGLSQALAVGLALVGGYRILNALADRVAEKRLAQERRRRTAGSMRPRMMRLKGLTLALCALMVLPAQASTRDEIARLQQGPARASTPVTPARWMTLSNGQRVNLNDWTVVLFMQGHCPYCQRFDPLLKALSDRHGFAVFAYTFDGQGDEAFPEAIPAPAAVMRTFFPGLPVASPTTFLVNVTTLAAFPLLQGASDEAGFMARLDTVLQDAARGGVR